MGEIKKPSNTKYWIVHNEDGSVMHMGKTEPNQVTTTGQPMFNIADTEDELVTIIAGKSSTMFPEIPQEGEECEEGEVYKYGANKAKCLQNHIRMHYTPEQTPALWLIIETTEGYPGWTQPTGAHDAYQTGDIVVYNGNLWISKIDANVTVPDGDEPYNRYWEPYTE
jgi:hypothetical protein